MQGRAKTRLILLGSMLLFAALAGIGLGTQRVGRQSWHTEAYAMEINIAGDYATAAMDFVAVRDTLEHHVGKMATQFGGLEMEWDLREESLGNGRSGVRAHLRVVFPAVEDRHGAFRRLGGTAGIGFQLLLADSRGLFGTTTGALTIPGGDGARMPVSGWKFHLGMGQAKLPWVG
jgi:hypothetical protein